MTLYPTCLFVVALLYCGKTGRNKLAQRPRRTSPEIHEVSQGQGTSAKPPYDVLRAQSEKSAKDISTGLDSERAEKARDLGRSSGDGRPPHHEASTRIEHYETEQIKEFCLEKEIRPLTSAEIQAKNEYFDKRYSVKFEPLGEDCYNVKISLKIGSEEFYENSVDFRKKELIGGYNYPSYDKEDRFDKGRMKLSDIKYQTWRVAIAEFGEKQSERATALHIDETSQPGLLSGKDVEESTVYKAVRGEQGLNLPWGQETHTITRDNERFNTAMLTKVGKGNLFLVGNYFSGSAFSEVRIITGLRGRYIASMEYQLMERRSLQE